MNSRLAFDQHGRLVAIEADGTRWLVLGNLVYSTSSGELVLFGWLGKSGRPPTAQERAEARPRYENPKARRWKVQVDDDNLTEQEALEACRREQERAPADLINVAT